MAVVAMSILFSACDNKKTNKVINDGADTEMADDDDIDDEGIKTVRVSNAHDFILALKSNTRIVVTKSYAINLTDELNNMIDDGFVENYYIADNPRHDKGVFAASEHDGFMIVVQGLHNITIESADDEEAHLQVSPRYADVLRFVDCRNITVEDIMLGHTDTGDCVGDVLGFYSCKNINIDGCQLYGCGVHGIQADQCSNLTVEDTYIYDCDQAAVVLNHVDNVKFDCCSIYNNGGGLCVYEDCTNVEVKNSHLSGNTGQLFICYSPVKLRKCTVEHHYDDNLDNVNTIDCDITMDYAAAETLPDIEEQ